MHSCCTNAAGRTDTRCCQGPLSNRSGHWATACPGRCEQPLCRPIGTVSRGARRQNSDSVATKHPMRLDTALQQQAQVEVDQFDTRAHAHSLGPQTRPVGRSGGPQPSAGISCQRVRAPLAMAPVPMSRAAAGTRRIATVAAQLNTRVAAKTISPFASAKIAMPSSRYCSQVTKT